MTVDALDAALTAAGYDVETLRDPERVAARVLERTPDVVLLDALSSQLACSAAARRVRMAAPSVGLLLTFPRTDLASRALALRVSADGYVCRPFERAELIDAVAGAVAQRALRARAEAASRSLEEARGIDALTRATSFGAMAERLATELRRAESHAEPLAACLLDVDGLREHNAHGGRARGDAVLRRVSAIARGSLRESDLVARYGGDELLVVLPRAHFAGAIAVGARILDGVSAAASELTEGPPVAVSVGVASFPSRDVRSLDGLLAALEAATFEAKRRGGGRLCVFHQDGIIHAPGDPGRVPGGGSP